MQEERAIAINKVLPYIANQLGWPRQLISEYGRVPVQTGTSVKWADIVCFAARQNRPSPYLVVEVKQHGDDLSQSVPQAESYALMLGCPFFGVTDGIVYQFYLTGATQGSCIPLEGAIPLPTKESLPKSLDYVPFPPELDPLVDLFFKALEDEPRFLEDTRWHSECLGFWNRQIFRRLDELAKDDVKEGIEKHMMPGREPVRRAILASVDKNFRNVKALLEFLRDWEGDALENLNSLLDRGGERHIDMFGPFIITQLLAAAHPMEYVLLQDNIARALRDLGLTSVAVKTDMANGYLFANEMCKRIYRDKIQERIGRESFGLASGCELAAVTNFLWHWYDNYRIGKPWGA